ncbi:MAG: hypothetical protein JO149_00910 [Gammaproteobacteria bacterium]|nr:hypothetical protein [Gammaproteobacteria bacterium]
MDLLSLLTTLAENAHHRISMEKLIKNQPTLVREALMANSNQQVRNMMGGHDINYPDRDTVVTIKE